MGPAVDFLQALVVAARHATAAKLAGPKRTFPATHRRIVYGQSSDVVALLLSGESGSPAWRRLLASRPALLANRAGEDLPAGIRIVALELGHHRAASAQTFEAAGAAHDFPHAALDQTPLRRCVLDLQRAAGTAERCCDRRTFAASAGLAAPAEC